ncbi:MAG: efflux RND transporter permease subunit [Flavobacteriia bacterium]|nr:efflux RND transporter permease subunit [Flavobacteriia bacterium]
MKEEIKGFGLTTWSVNNRKTVYLIMVILFFGGLISYNTMPKENFPEIQIPEIYIGIAKPGSSPDYMSEKIAKSIEKEISSIRNVDEVKSNAVHGYVTLQVKFNFSVSVDKALQKVKDAVDKARSKTDFPEIPVEPNIFELDPSQMPIMNINLRGNNASLLKDIAEELEDRFEALQEINEVDIRGIQKQEMRIEVDPIRAQSVNVTLDDIQNAVASEHQTIPGGEILMDGVKKTIRIEGEFENADELKKIIVKQDELMPVHLEDIASVYFGNADTNSYAREFGSPVVMLDIKKQAGENLLIAADKIDEIISTAKSDGLIPVSVKVSKTNDQSYNTRDMVSNLENSIIFGILLVVLVLLFFLGLRNALFVGVAIPLSMLMSFLILQAMGVSLNVMVLFSLVLALGMLVDNGIVIVENIYRHMDEGLSSSKAVIKGVGEVAWPIISSTATTVAAFIPLAIWPGIMGEFMKYLPITLMIVLSSSLFVALVINPVLAVAYMKVEESKSNFKKMIKSSIIFIVIGFLFLMMQKNSLGNLLIIIGLLAIFNFYVLIPGTRKFQNNFLPKLENMYGNFLHFALGGKKPLMMLFSVIVLFILSIILLGVFPPKVDFFPVNEPNYVNIFISHPAGTDIKTTNQTAIDVEKELNNILKPFLDKDKEKAPNSSERIIKSIITQVGEGTSDPAQGVSLGNTPNRARITVNFTESQYRNGVKTGEILKDIQDKLKGKFPADIEISANKDEQGPPQGAPINIDVFGKSKYKDLLIEAEKLKNYLELKSVAGVEKLKLNVESNRLEIPIEVDRSQIRKLNASTMQVGMAIRKALLGQEISTYTKDEESYDIVVRFNRDYRDNFDILLDQQLIFRNNKGELLNIPIRSVIKNPTEYRSHAAVIRKNEVPLVSIISNVVEGYNANEVVEDLKGYLADYESENIKNNDISYQFAGQQNEQEKEMAFLSKALLIAVFLVLLIIVAQFNSFSSPALIMFTVLLSFIGVFLGLVISRQNFVIMMTMIGIISLAGVVVNNGIVLIDYTVMLIKERRAELNLDEFEETPIQEVIIAAEKAGKTRLRPVLLTAITTILGLVPLAVGFNIDFFSFLESYDAKIYIGGDNNVFFAPMSWTIIYGLTFATFLTLVIIPSLFIISTRFKSWIFRKAGWKMRSNY